MFSYFEHGEARKKYTEACQRFGVAVDKIAMEVWDRMLRKASFSVMCGLLMYFLSSMGGEKVKLRSRWRFLITAHTEEWGEESIPKWLSEKFEMHVKKLR